MSQCEGEPDHDEQPVHPGLAQLPDGYVQDDVKTRKEKEYGEEKSRRAKAVIHKEMGDAGPELSQNIGGIRRPVPEILQYALVLFPVLKERIKGNEQEDRGTEDQYAENQMGLLALEKVRQPRPESSLLYFGTGFFPFRHRPQKYTNNLAYNMAARPEKLLK